MILGLLEHTGRWWRHARHAAGTGWWWKADGPSYQGWQSLECSRCGWTTVR